ncbi:MAG: hypothetical protein QOG71_3867 [Pyrinomonadaceae bacterium]|nr:hypothetical protein [Pyrinomonadaceae bacterium]
MFGTRKLTLSIIFLASLVFGGTTSGNAQPSLASADIREMQISVSSRLEDFTVIRDAQLRDQYYYVPTRPRLVEVTNDGRNEPQFSLIRYQFVNPDDPNGLLEGGILQFAVKLAAPGVAEQIRKKISQETSRPEASIRVASLPLKSAEVVMYSPGQGKLVSKTFGSGIAPQFATQEMAFSIELSRVGSDVFDALVGNTPGGNTGVPVAVIMTYNGLTPPAGFRIKVNYRKLYNHYSSDQKLAARASYYGLFGASTNVRWQNLSESLKRDGALDIKKISGEGVDDAVLDQHMQAILKGINERIFQTLSPPRQVEPAQAADPSASGFFGGVGYNASFKNVNEVSSLDETIEWTEQRIIERKTLAAGFIGIQGYPQDIRNRLVTFVREGNWDSAFFMLPTVGNLPQLSQVNLKVDLEANGTSRATKTVVWKPSTDWKDSSGRVMTSVVFPIAGLLASGVKRDQLSFSSTLETIQGGSLTRIVKKRPVFNGTEAVAPPETDIEIIEIDPSAVQWRGIDPNSRLLRVQVLLRAGNREFRTILRPQNNSGVVSVPSPIGWIVSKEEVRDKDIRVELKYEFQGRPAVSKVIARLQRDEPSLSLLLPDVEQ